MTGRESMGSGGPGRALLGHAVSALQAVLGFEHVADGVLSRYFREHRGLGGRDRAFVAESVYGVLRRLRWLTGFVEGDVSPRRLLIAWLVRGAGYSARQLEPALSPVEQAWAARLKSVDLGERTLAEQADLPDWLADMLSAQLGGNEAVLALMQALNTTAPLDLRVNALKASRDDVLRILSEEGFVAEACPFAPYGIRLQGKPPINAHPLFLDGRVEVQDEGSQLLAHLLAPRRGELVVDFCAGAGGKTLALGALMRSTGRLYALDVSERRLSKLRPRAARAGLSNIHPMLIDSERDQRLKRLAGKADRVLVDAPCSGLGTLRRNPDLKWRQTPATLAKLVETQRAILEAASRLVRPSGRLVYATCSVLREENEAAVEAFQMRHPEFLRLDAEVELAQQGIELRSAEQEGLHLGPQTHGTDGFFAAVLQRAG